MGLKQGYKLTGVGVIPEDWEMKPIGEFTDCTAGGTPSTRISEYWNGSIRWMNSGELNLRYVYEVEGRITDAGLKNSSTKMIPEMCVLIGLAGQGKTRGTVAMNFIPLCTNQSIASIFPNIAFIPAYLYFHLYSRYEELRNLSSGGGGRGGLNLSIIRSIQVPFPPLSEQRAIATALSDVDALLNSLDQLIAKKRNIKQATMQQLLTGKTRLPGFESEWEEKQLGDVAEIVMGQSPSSSNYNSNGDGLPLIQGNADIENRRTVKRIFTTQITKQGKAGDILMSVRAPVGEIARATFDVCLGRGVCAIRFPNDFLYHYLIFLEPKWAKHSKGSTFDSVNSTDVKSVKITFPAEPEEQIAISTILSDMDAEIIALVQRRDKTRDLKQAMMQELLTGKTRLLSPVGCDA